MKLTCDESVIRKKLNFYKNIEQEVTTKVGIRFEDHSLEDFDSRTYVVTNIKF